MPFGANEATQPRDPKPDDWVLAQGERDGFPMMVRMANAFSGLAPIPDYDHHVIVSIHFRDRTPNGFPSGEEADDLDNLEVGLCRVLEMDNESLCVLAITNNGLRDLIFYTRDAYSVRKKLEANAPLYGEFQVEFAIEPDLDWRIYQVFSRMFGVGGSGKKTG